MRERSSSGTWPGLRWGRRERTGRAAEPMQAGSRVIIAGLQSRAVNSLGGLFTPEDIMIILINDWDKTGQPKLRKHILDPLHINVLCRESQSEIMKQRTV